MPYDMNKDQAVSSDSAQLSAPAAIAVAVTTSDTVDLPAYAKSLYVGVTGDVAVVPLYAQTDAGVVFKGALAGTVLPVRCRRVLATGTTATNIVALIS